MPVLAALVLANAKRDLAAVWSWLCHRSFWQLVGMALGCIIVVQHFALADARHDRDAWRKQFTAEHAGRLADRDAYRKAQADAHQQNLNDVARVKAEQERITHEKVSGLNDRLELIRRELRKPAPQGAPGNADLSQSGGAACRAFDPAWLCLSPEDRLRAAENEERHDTLIDWVTDTAKIDPNK